MAQKYTSKYTAPGAAKQAQPAQSTPAQFVFGKNNYRVFLLAIAVVILGFALMTGTTDIYDFRKIVLAPLTVLAGFAIGFFAIFQKPENKA